MKTSSFNIYYSFLLCFYLYSLGGEKMQDYIHTRHSVYMLTYHMIFVTKWRKPVISDEIGDFMVDTVKRLCVGYGGELISGETDKDHIHLLISLPPQANVANVIRSLKTQLSKEVHTNEKYNSYIQKYIHGDAPLWSGSYFVATAGSVSMETVKSYIESQRTDEHKRKYEKKDRYWDNAKASRFKKK